MAPMLSTFGESFINIGMSPLTSFTCLVTAAASGALQAKGFPNSSSTLGQLMFTSRKSGFSFAMCSAVLPKSSMEPATTFPIRGAGLFSR